MRKTREQIRNERAERVCREVRYQIGDNFSDSLKLYDLLMKWMRVAKQNKYKRPE